MAACIAEGERVKEGKGEGKREGIRKPAEEERGGRYGQGVSRTWDDRT